MSALPTNVMPFPADTTERPTLDQLVASWMEAKRAEDAAAAERLRVERLICELNPPREEGSCTVDLPSGFKLVMTGKLNYRVTDMARLQQLVAQLPESLRPIKTETKLDESGAKWLRANEPTLWAQIAPAIEVKPAKTAVKVSL